MLGTKNEVAIGYAVKATLDSNLSMASIAPALLAMYEAGRAAARLDLDAVTRRERENVRSAFPAFWDVYAAMCGDDDGAMAESLYRNSQDERRQAITRMRSMFTLGYLEVIEKAS